MVIEILKKKIKLLRSTVKEYRQERTNGKPKADEVEKASVQKKKRGLNQQGQERGLTKRFE